MEERVFGKTGLRVSILGLGAGLLGTTGLNERDAERLLNGALDLGIKLIDTARGYGLSEERIGRYLSHRRAEFVLSTKVGYGIAGYQDWTGPCVAAGIDTALKVLHTDSLDIVHLHSCSLEVLQHGDVAEALERSVRDGKVRVAAFSGENRPLRWAVDSGRFGSIQLSVNLCDQEAIETMLPDAERAALGVIAKRPLANAPWLSIRRPDGDDVAQQDYWDRWQAMGLWDLGTDPAELALRFAAFAPGVHCSIVGSSNLRHLEENVRMVSRGPLPTETVSAIQQAFRKHGEGWRGQI